MKILKEIEERALLAAKKLKYEVTYLPGLIEELDQFKAQHDTFFIVNCYGATREEALAAAINEASFLLLEEPKLITQLLNK